jgi:nanoRNase/pAp phosphatase (c-di-AMP/oligoRNAs hydrolase)
VDQTVQLANLLAAMEDAGEVVVLTHDNPDPDAIASAAALGFLLERAGGHTTRLAFGGIIGRAENRALIEELGAPFVRVQSLEIPAAASVALVDTQPRTGNNSLPEGRIATVVVDHHPLRPESSAVPFADVRPGYGASCSILVEYLRAAQLEPSRSLATALFYGIQSETMDLGREVSEADISASTYLYPRSDPAAISRIRHARVPATYFESMHEALREARRYGGVIVVPMGRLDYPDMVAEVADLFMRVEGVEWTVASGRYHDDLLISIRTYTPEANAGELVRQAIGDRGSAGGHGMLAGAQVSLKGKSDLEIEELVTAIIGDLLRELGVDARQGEGLIPEGGSGSEPVGGTGEEGGEVAPGPAPGDEEGDGR